MILDNSCLFSSYMVLCAFSIGIIWMTNCSYTAPPCQQTSVSDELGIATFTPMALVRTVRQRLLSLLHQLSSRQEWEPTSNFQLKQTQHNGCSQYSLSDDIQRSVIKYCKAAVYFQTMSIHVLLRHFIIMCQTVYKMQHNESVGKQSKGVLACDVWEKSLCAMWTTFKQPLCYFQTCPKLLLKWHHNFSFPNWFS